MPCRVGKVCRGIVHVRLPDHHHRHQGQDGRRPGHSHVLARVIHTLSLLTRVTHTSSLCLYMTHVIHYHLKHVSQINHNLTHYRHGLLIHFV